MSVTRNEVYSAIDTERSYQDAKWNSAAHSPAEFLIYMRDYIEEALHQCSRTPDPEAFAFSLNNIRKVSALGVACMEQHGAPKRT